MPEVVIPLLYYTTNNYVELRFTLRSIALFIPDAHITLIGAKPLWIKNVDVIQATDSPDTIFKERNIFKKLLQAPYAEFIYANDDHFLLRPWSGAYYYENKLSHKLLSLTRGSIYRQTVHNTLRIYPKINNFDVHCPMTISRDALHLMQRIKWDAPYGYCFKSAYCAMHGIQGESAPDLKLRHPIINLQEAVQGRPFFSSADNVWDRDMIDQMKLLYPNRSPWE